MTNFASALKKGIDAHRDAARARAEIAAVFAALADQIRSMGLGITVTHERCSRPTPGQRRTIIDQVTGVLPETEGYDALVVHRVDNMGWRGELCEVEFAPLGYPVTLRYPHHQVRCIARPDLELELQRLLETPHAGEVCMRAQREPNAAPSPTAGSP